MRKDYLWNLKRGLFAFFGKFFIAYFFFSYERTFQKEELTEIELEFFSFPERYYFCQFNNFFPLIFFPTWYNEFAYFYVGRRIG